MESRQSGYWDFYQDSVGYWHWRFVCTELERPIASTKGHASSEECLHDAIEHGYNRLSEHRVTRALY
jgi:uncharacterized protein YegP (UPF0339 family)